MYARLLALLTMAWIFPSVFQNVLFQTSTLIGREVAMCTPLWFHPSVNFGVALQINILTEMLFAVGALVLLGFASLRKVNIAHPYVPEIATAHGGAHISSIGIVGPCSQLLLPARRSSVVDPVDVFASPSPPMT